MRLAPAISPYILVGKWRFLASASVRILSEMAHRAATFIDSSDWTIDPPCMSPESPQRDTTEQDGIVVKVLRAGQGSTISHLVYLPRIKQLCAVPFALFEEVLPPDASKRDADKWALKERQYILGDTVTVTVVEDVPYPRATQIWKGPTGRWKLHVDEDVVSIRSKVVFSPDSPPQCHSQLFTDCRSRESLSEDALLRNVCYDAWLRLEVRETELDLLTDAARIATITAHVAQLDGPAVMERAPRERIVLTAPWNSEDQPLVHACDDNAHPRRDANMLLGEEGFLLEKPGRVFNPRTPDDAVRVDYLRGDQSQALVPGQWVRFDAFYCRFNKCFVVTKLKSIPDREMVIGVQDGREERVLYKLSISKSPKVRGYFVSSELGADCLIADPDCVFWQVRDAGHVGRVWARFLGNDAAAKFIVKELFSVEGTGVRRLPKMPQVIKEEGIFVGGPQSRIFCPRWPLLDVSQQAHHGQEPLKILPGQSINFEASRTRSHLGYLYTSNATQADDRHASAFRLTHNGTEFLARLRAVGNRACYSDTFGLVQDRLRIIEINALHNTGKDFLAWIRHVPFVDDQAEHRRTASFELVALEATDVEISVPRDVQVVQRKPAATEADTRAAHPHRLPDDESEALELLGRLAEVFFITLMAFVILVISELLVPTPSLRFWN
ncbi:hypothetical protein AAVH_05907 [Aphelenchoides avenae]|nr:hypothetical protein AAVH_05907 [Aphelenchus avenae]